MKDCSPERLCVAVFVAFPFGVPSQETSPGEKCKESLRREDPGSPLKRLAEGCFLLACIIQCGPQFAPGLTCNLAKPQKWGRSRWTLGYCLSINPWRHVLKRNWSASPGTSRPGRFVTLLSDIQHPIRDVWAWIKKPGVNGELARFAERVGRSHAVLIKIDTPKAKETCGSISSQDTTGHDESRMTLPGDAPFQVNLMEHA